MTAKKEAALAFCFDLLRAIRIFLKTLKMQVKCSGWKLFIVIVSGMFLSILNAQETRKVIVDADTGNEVDDFYALARIFLEPSLEVIGLNSTHWQTSHWTVTNSMENSHRLNQQLLGEMGLGQEIMVYRGGLSRMYDWGDRAQHSAATSNIIEQATDNEQLTVIALGALTNVASAIYIKPEIASKLKVYWLGTSMDFDSKVLKRNDFNPLMDPFALDYLLESEVELFIMPVNVAQEMQIDFTELNNNIGNTKLGKFLIKRWIDHLDGSRENRVLWDLALVTAFIKPEMAMTTSITTSRDSGNRMVNFYSHIDAKAIYQDFYRILLAFENE